MPRFFCHPRFDSESGPMASTSRSDEPRLGDGPRETVPFEGCWHNVRSNTRMVEQYLLAENEGITYLLVLDLLLGDVVLEILRVVHFVVDLTVTMSTNVRVGL